MFSFGDSWVQSAWFFRSAHNASQRTGITCRSCGLESGEMVSLDTMIDGTFPMAELDLALLQISEGTQGAQMLTLHPPFLGNFSRHLALSETSV